MFRAASQMCSWQSLGHVYAPQDLKGTKQHCRQDPGLAESWCMESPHLPFWILCTCRFTIHHADPLLGEVLGLPLVCTLAMGVGGSPQGLLELTVPGSASQLALPIL